MASKRSPSGLPSGRIVRQVYGPAEIDVHARVGNQHAGFVRTRRTLLRVALAVAVLVGVLALTGNTASASGAALILLAPLAFFIVCLQPLVMFTDPGRRRRSG